MKGKALICFEDAVSGQAVLTKGIELAERLGYEPVIIHVQVAATGIAGTYDNLFHEELEQIESLFGDPGQEELLYVRKHLGGTPHPPRFILASGVPSTIILNALAGGEYKIVMIGDRKDDGPGKIGLDIIKGSPVSVLVIKG